MKATSIASAAARQGWRVRRGSKHLICYPPDKSLRPIAVSNSDISQRAYLNTVLKFRRAGLNI